jgi:ribosomal protein L37E
MTPMQKCHRCGRLAYELRGGLCYDCEHETDFP